ncbi:MAG: hypothetical protein AABY01_02920 [Nanoarchaeota archaeon]
MPVRFQQRCAKCKKNMVPMYSSKQFPICAPCQMSEINQPIDNAAMKKFFNLPEALYQESSFLRSIKSNYLKFGNLSPKQKEMFVKVANELKLGIKKDKKIAKPAPLAIGEDPGDKLFKDKLIVSLTDLVKKDTKARRLTFFELVEEIHEQPITDFHLKHAIDKLTERKHGRPAALIMTTSEMKDVLARVMT